MLSNYSVNIFQQYLEYTLAATTAATDYFVSVYVCWSARYLSIGLYAHTNARKHKQAVAAFAASSILMYWWCGLAE